MSNRRLRGYPRPTSPQWQLSQAELFAMIARPHFSRFVITRKLQRRSESARRSHMASPIATASHKQNG